MINFLIIVIVILLLIIAVLCYQLTEWKEAAGYFRNEWQISRNQIENMLESGAIDFKKIKHKPY